MRDADAGGPGVPMADPDPRETIPSLIPHLRVAAHELVGDPAEADGLVVETLAEALVGWGAAEPGAARRWRPGCC